jgi:hypothetical protein
VFPPRAVVGQLGAKRAAQLANFPPVMDALDDLLRAERNQHADDDDPDFARDVPLDDLNETTLNERP